MMVRMARLLLVPLLALLLVMLPGLRSCKRQGSVIAGMTPLPSDEHAAFIVPLVRKSHDNVTAVHLRRQQHRRQLIAADTYVKLYDNLETAG